MFLLTLTGYGKERIEDVSKQEERKGKIYVIGEKKSYTGTFIVKNQSGKLEYELKFKDGIFLEEKGYYSDGKILYISVYSEEREGITKSYYKSGKLRLEKMTKNGIEEGQLKLYYENGSLQSITEYKDGEEITPTKWYDENGNPKPFL